ncbi:monovalent cation/H+ antiporter complex subunit F [Serinibacter salmoneus]|uniref:Multicomponent Na+:H+ antiporter subunit F n=1 Tax=Serinibacter salmoneus TaxID=556530 RepID=A0A2A9CYA8_9MICO|nr:monovalent cation/H+ antiporter complex subunit F [Serinibacter salmoneus]PFG18600.1 multicomponent Na+:H+ antiporter subunit F [Serinibacter salmoneus]
MNPVIVTICGVMLAIGAACVVARTERGQSMLDRVVAVDVIVAIVLASVALLSAYTMRIDVLPVLVVLALLGFVGSVTVSRFAAAESDEERRILTPEEAAAQRAERQRLAELDIAEEREGALTGEMPLIVSEGESSGPLEGSLEGAVDEGRSHGAGEDR